MGLEAPAPAASSQHAREATVLADLPDLAVQLVASHLVERFRPQHALSRDAQGRLAGLSDGARAEVAQLAASLACASRGGVWQALSSALLDQLVDPGCREAHRQAVVRDDEQRRQWREEREQCQRAAREVAALAADGGAKATDAQLAAKCRELGVRGFSGAKKARKLELLQGHVAGLGQRAQELERSLAATPLGERPFACPVAAKVRSLPALLDPAPPTPRA